jgi:hypothetical protein
MNDWKIIACLLLGLLTLNVSADAVPADALQVTGAVGLPGDWHKAQFQKHFAGSVQSVTYTRKGVKHTAHAVPLWTVLQAAQPRINPQIKNHWLQFVVLVRGRDGYTAAFSLAELSPDFGQRHVWLALDEDGKPFGGDAGPVDLLATDDKKAGRWVHSVVNITCVDEAQTAPAGKA